MNIELAQKIIKKLTFSGVRCFCLCPGGRSAPFVEVLSKARGLETFYFFEERSAGFFALGRARRDLRATAILSTSGTAVAELLPSVIEAYYSSLPVVLVTADRPLKFGQKGAPQTLKKALSLFKDYCFHSQNVSTAKDINLSSWNPSQGHLHLNVCFNEPLIDKKPYPLDFSKHKQKTPVIYNRDFSRFHPTGFNKTSSKAQTKITQNRLQKFFKNCKKPLLLIGELKFQEKPAVQELLQNYNGLCYIEALSNVEYKTRLLSGEKILNYAVRRQIIDGVIRIGGIPRIRFWRDLERESISVLNLSSPPYYPGLARACFNLPLLDSIKPLSSYLSPLKPLKKYGQELKDLDQKQTQKWKHILNKYPQSEDFWIWTLKQSLKQNSKVFLGNSQPMRLWNRLAFCEKKNLSITGQSGVNGIEGLVSRFLGECSAKSHNVGIIGDLSLLYDMPGFWKAKKLPPWILVVINNSGGQIFSQLFSNPAFLNSHQLSFAPLAKMWGLNYSLYKDSAKFKWPEKPYHLIEIQPKNTATKACFQDYLSLWRKL